MRSAKASSVCYVSDLVTQQLSQLVCPVCYEYMRPPIMQCAVGHGICELCHELLSECPICHTALTHRRSSHLEYLTSQVLFPCTKCKLKYPLGALTAHQCVEADVKINCLIGQVYGDCAWTGSARDLTEHCRKRHPQNYWTSTQNTATWHYGHLSSIGIQNIYLVDLGETVFVLVQKFDSVSHSLQWNISCESEKIGERYIYEIKLCSETDVTSCRSYRNSIENEENILTFFPRNNEISIPVKEVTGYVRDNYLQYKIVIHKDDGCKNEVARHFTCSDMELTELSPRVSIDNAKESCSQKTCNAILRVYNFIKSQLSCSK